MPEKADVDEKSDVGDQTPSQLTQSYYNKNTAVTDKRLVANVTSQLREYQIILFSSSSSSMSSRIVKQPPYEQNESDETSSFSEESGTYSSITGKSRSNEI